MNEADRKKKLVAEVCKLGGQARRLEDRYAVGLLDLVIKLPHLPVVWAECKLIDGYLFEPTLAQWEEGRKWEKAGVMVLLLGWKSDVMYISEWVKQADLRNCYRAVSNARGLQEYLTFIKKGN